MERVPVASQNCTTCSVRDKSVVCDLEGAEFDTFRSIRLSLLCSGKVKLTRTSAGGQRQIVGIAKL